MAKRNRDTKAILRTIERSERRSSLFWWMVEHHDEVMTAAKRERIHWVGFCVEAGRRGLKDTRGRPPTPRIARDTWAEAKRVVAAARAAEGKQAPPRPGSIYPSRMPKEWRPEALKRMGAAAGSSGSEGATGTASTGTGTALIAVRPRGVPATGAPVRRSRFASPNDSPAVQEAMLAAEEQLEQADWYLNLGRKRRKD
ncbi:MAG: hypothetical protein ACREFP_16625 [Acetobacteraceae bacterium]